MRTPRYPFAFLLPVVVACGGSADLPAPTDDTVTLPDAIAEGLGAFAAGPVAPEEEPEEEPADNGLGFVTVGDVRHPILSAGSASFTDMGCGPGMLEVDITFQPAGEQVQVVHLDLSPSLALPAEPTTAVVPGDLMWRVEASQCDGPCDWDNLAWLGNGEGRLSLHAEDDIAALADVELGFPGLEEVPVKVTLTAARVANVYVW